MKHNRGQFLIYGFDREPKVRRFLYSVLISTIYFLAIGIPLLLGYMIRIVENRSEGENIEKPPRFNPILPMIKKGSVTISYALVMMGVPISTILIINFAFNTFVTSSSQITLAVAIIVNVSLATSFVILVLGTFLFIPMIISYVREDTWRSGYTIEDLSSVIYTRKYTVLYAKFMLFSILAGYLTVNLIQSVILAPVGAISWFVYINGIGIMIGDFMRNELSDENVTEHTER